VLILASGLKLFHFLTVHSDNNWHIVWIVPVILGRCHGSRHNEPDNDAGIFLSIKD